MIIEMITLSFLGDSLQHSNTTISYFRVIEFIRFTIEKFENLIVLCTVAIMKRKHTSQLNTQWYCSRSTDGR